MYQIKQKPEDFIVKEIPLYGLDEDGEYFYFWLIKKDYTTMGAIKTIAKRLNIPLKRFSFAGTKDKVAVTKQVISIQSIKKERVEKIENLKLTDIKLKYIGNGITPICLGDLEGNEFVIIVRNLKTKRIKSKEKIPNLYGPQRFSKNNAEIGRYLVKNNFKKATDLIDQEEVKYHLEENPVDFVGALRKIPLKIRKIYIHAYQGLLWNKTIESYLKTGPHKNIKIPLIGFGTEIESIQDYNLKEIILDILHKEEISERDFILPKIKELSSEGGKRDLFIKPKDLNIKITEDEENKEKFKAVVSFFLQKGSYGTVVIDSIFQGL